MPVSSLLMSVEFVRQSTLVEKNCATMFARSADVTSKEVEKSNSISRLPDPSSPMETVSMSNSSMPSVAAIARNAMNSWVE